jgi:hypothetical protein
MKTQSGFVFFLIVIFLLGCKHTDVQPNNIDPAFQSFYDKFVIEGKKRGFIEPKGVTIKFGDTKSNGKIYGGLTFYETNSIAINQTNWDYSPELYHELLLFHELGHLILKRNHFNAQLPDGEAASLMASDDDISTNQGYSDPIYQSFRQKYYIDELFDPKTPAPDWSSKSLIQTPIPATGTLLVESTFNSATKLPIFPNVPKLQTTIQNGRLKIVNNDTTYYSLGFNNFLPIYNVIDTKNFDLRFRFRSATSAIEWKPNNDKANQLAFIQDNTLNIVIYAGGGSFTNLSATAAASDWNDMVIQYDGLIFSVWLNGQMLFRGEATNPQASDVWRAAALLNPKDNIEFDYIRLYKR